MSRAALWFTAARLLIALRVAIWYGSAVWHSVLVWLIGAAVAVLLAVPPVYWD